MVSGCGIQAQIVVMLATTRLAANLNKTRVFVWLFMLIHDFTNFRLINDFRFHLFFDVFSAPNQYTFFCKTDPLISSKGGFPEIQSVAGHAGYGPRMQSAPGSR